MYAYACAHIHTPISIQVHKHGRLWWSFHYVWWFLCTNNKQSEHLGGPGHASDGAFLPGEILLKTIDFERPGGQEWLPSGTPFLNFLTCFGRFFGPACVRISYAFPLRNSFFCNVHKVRTKIPMYGYQIEARSGGTPGPVFLHFFWKGFRTRACKDIICILAQKRLFGNVKTACACLGYKRANMWHGRRPHA